eukprot:COSAG02_NODE_3654_length_6410_cov_11.576929_5_plen_45_part_00
MGTDGCILLAVGLLTYISQFRESGSTEVLGALADAASCHAPPCG